MNFEAYLVKERAELTKTAGEKKDMLKELKISSPDDADSANQIEQRDSLHREINSAADRIRSINTALRRIETGEFGYCDDCGVDIPEKRLKLQPHASRCVECQSAHEHHKMHYRRPAA